MILPKKHLIDIERIGHPIISRMGQVTLDRNERTIDLPSDVLDDLRELVTGYVLRTYPEMDNFYNVLSQWSGFSTTQLLATDGADGAIHRVFATYISEGDEVIILSPTYAMYPVYCQMYGAKTQVLTFNDNLELPFAKIMKSITEQTRLLALVNPNQPIEACYSFDQLQQLAEHCKNLNTLLLIDEAYFHFCEITGASLTKDYDNIIIARTFSKAFGLAGLRIGYIIASPSTIKFLRVLKPIYEINHLNVAIATYFLEKPEIMASYANDINLGRDVLISFFDDYKCKTYGKSTNTLLVELPSNIPADKLVNSLRQTGWLIRAQMETPTTNHIRITIGTPKQMKQLCCILEPYLS